LHDYDVGITDLKCVTILMIRILRVQVPLTHPKFALAINLKWKTRCGLLWHLFRSNFDENASSILKVRDWWFKRVFPDKRREAAKDELPLHASCNEH